MQLLIKRIVTGLLLVGFFGLSPGFAESGGEDKAGEKFLERRFDEYMEEQIRDYILRHPEVILQSLRNHETRQRQAKEQKVKATIKAREKELLFDPDSPVGGNPDGDVTVVEFFDYNCPYCRRVTPMLVQLQAQDPGVRIVYKEFPVLGPESVYAARAALAARAQGKYLELHEALMQVEKRLTEEQVLGIAQRVGLDTDRLQKDMQNLELNAVLSRNRQLADELEVTGTPSFVVGENFIGGATNLENMRGLVAKARQ